MDKPPPRILAICTGNICRSPAIERLFRQRLTSEVIVGSAGTHAVVGQPIAPSMAVLLGRVGAPTSGYLARQITDNMINEADLILTATVDHRAQVVSMQPLAMHRAFTLLEFTQSISMLDPFTVTHLPLRDRIQPLIEHVRMSRPHMRLPEDQLDIPDPFGLGKEEYNTAFTLIYQAVATISYVLTVT